MSTASDDEHPPTLTHAISLPCSYLDVPVIVCDPIVSGDEHVSFNAGLICIATMVSSAPVAVWADPDHFGLVRTLLPADVADRVVFSPHIPPPRRLPFGTRSWRDAGCAWSAIRRAAQAGERHVVLSCAFPGTLIGAKLAMASLAKRHRPVVHAVVHSALKDVWGWRSRHPIRRALDMTSALTWPTPGGFRIVVLETRIANDLARKLPQLAEQLLVLELPIVETVPAPGPRRPGPLRVGFLGRANREKGFDRFCELARAVAARGANVEFHAVGQIEPGAFSEAELMPLVGRPQQAPLERAAFLHQLLELDLVVMLHDLEHYAHTPSGVLLDAVAAERPVLSTPNPIVDALVVRHGAIGPRVEDLDAATDFLAGLDLTALERPDFSAWRENIRRVAASRRPSALAIGYARELTG